MNEDEFAKTFRDLISEVQKPGLCGLCGGCISFCSAGDLMAIGIGEDGSPGYMDENNCLECGICYLICPQIDALDQDIKDKYQWRAPYGKYSKVLSARSTDPEIRKRATDGGVVTAILHCLLKKKIIDGAIVSKKTAQFAREPMIATSYEDILSAAGSRFAGSAGVEELSRFSTYSPTMFAIKEIDNMDLLKIAVVGTPCQVHTIRKMQSLNVVPSHVVKYVLGLFCIESFAFDASKREEVESILGASFDEIENMNIREDLIISLKNGEIKKIPLKEMERFSRSACLACWDFANDFADLSFGGVGSPSGWTTVVIRTEGGSAVFDEAIRYGFLEILTQDNNKFDPHLASRLDDKITYFSDIKKERAAKTHFSIKREVDIIQKL